METPSTIELAPPLGSTSAASSSPPVETRCVGRRVDALTIAFQVEMVDALEIVRHRSAVAADIGGAAELAIGSFVGRLRRPKTYGAERWPIENADLRGMVEPRASGGWNLEITLRATYLATHTLEQVCALAESTAESFGAVKHRRVRRLDVCADFVGFALSRDDSRGFIIPRSGHLTNYQPRRNPEARYAEVAGVLPELRSYQSSDATITGFTICPKGDLQARIYNKSEELRRGGDEQKREVEERGWTAHGWTTEEVTRVEFQMRGTVLDDMDRRKDPVSQKEFSPLRRPTTIVEELDAVWSYLTSREYKDGESGWSGLTWMRLCAPETATRRARCELDPRWSVVQAVTFTHEAAACRRTRRRGGASWAQTFGSMLSSLASQGDLGRVNIEQGTESFRSIFRELPEDERSDYARGAGLTLILDLCMTAGIHLHQALFSGKRGVTDLEQDPDVAVPAPTPHDVALEIAEKVNATWARFRSSDDPWTFPPHYEVTAGLGVGEFTIRLVNSSGVPPPLPDKAEKAERAALIDA